MMTPLLAEGIDWAAAKAFAMSPLPRTTFPA